MGSLSLIAVLISVATPPDESSVNVNVSDLLDFQRRDVRNFVFCSETRQLFVSHLDKKDDRLYQWDVDTKKLVHVYRLGDGFFCDNVTLAPDGRVAVVGCFPDKIDGPCKTLILDTREKTIAHDLGRDDRIFSVRFNRDGTRFLLSTTDFEGSKGVAYETSARRIDKFDPAEFERQTDARIWRIERSKVNADTAGLYCKDDSGRVHRLTDNEWHDYFGVTKDRRFVACTTWDGELIVWRLSDGSGVARKKMARQYGYLQYDPKSDRFLWGDATDDGTTKLKVIEVGK
jgi:hypothetical protein